MTTGISTFSTATAQSAQASAVLTVRVSTTAPTAAVAAAVATGLPVSSPITSVDAASGAIITQFLSSSGDLQLQTPSAAAVAYLRAGLTKSGESKNAVYQSHNTTDSIASVEYSGTTA